MRLPFELPRDDPQGLLYHRPRPELLLDLDVDAAQSSGGVRHEFPGELAAMPPGQVAQVGPARRIVSGRGLVEVAIEVEVDEFSRPVLGSPEHRRQAPAAGNENKRSSPFFTPPPKLV